MVKPRENRVPIMMSEEELQAIDDWRFNNRIATRSDAVRKLTKIGIITDEWIMRAGELIDSAQEIYLNKIAKFADLHPESHEDIREVTNALSLAWVEVMKVTFAASELRTQGNVQEALETVDGILKRGLEERALLMEQKLLGAKGSDE